MTVSPRPYVSRDEAAAIFDGTRDHIYQGDIFQSLELRVPRPGGTFESPLFDGVMVVSHDCEYTKVAGKVDKPLLVAPLRSVRAFPRNDAAAIRSGSVIALWLLPEAGPIDDAYAIDFRLIQPLPVGDLLDAVVWACLGPDLKNVLQARLMRFFLRAEPK